MLPAARAPVIPSSPGAHQVSFTEPAEVPGTAETVWMLAGGVVSPADGVANVVAPLEIPDQFGFSSAVQILKKYVDPPVRLLIV